MTIAELKHLLDAIEEREGLGPNTPVWLADTGSCFLEEPALAVDTHGKDPLVLIKRLASTDLAERFCPDGPCDQAPRAAGLTAPTLGLPSR